MVRALICLISLVFFQACAVDRTYGAEESIEVTNLDALPEPQGDYVYTIGPQEALEVIVVGAEDLSGKFLTNEDGNLVFPYLGLVEIGGLSLDEASNVIAVGLEGRVVLDPQIRIIPEEFPEPSISVGGEVQRPGSYPAAGRPSLLEVINQAEGLDEYAQKEDVLVLRTVDGQRYIGAYSLAAIERGNYPDPRLYPNDVVMVGESAARRRVDGIFKLLAPVLPAAVILIDRLAQ